MMPMKFLTPDIEKLTKQQSTKSLAKPGISCGIFQDLFDKTQDEKNRISLYERSYKKQQTR